MATAQGGTEPVDGPGGARAASGAGLDAALERVGDRWSLLIVDALLERPRRFGDLEEAVPGLAPNVLAARLRRLQGDGLVMALPYSARPARYEYRATEDGRQLAGALRLLSHWGAQASGRESERPRHRVCGTPLEAHWYCTSCEQLADGSDDGVAWV
jgi:DNA-binding HxlR family transcriptional regulator